jgi:hypothetical protein
MNIFYLDSDPATCAQYHCDKHVIKMILESAQLLSTAHHELESPLAKHLYKKTHANHPSALWARESAAHYEWLYQLLTQLSLEYTNRYLKTHRTYDTLGAYLSVVPPKIQHITSWTDPPQCMPDAYKDNDTVTAYRRYYMQDKPFAVWEHTATPKWYAPCS